ncbi:MAG: type II secretion system major pseudopilin GspG [Halieaceae bacterium]
MKRSSALKHPQSGFSLLEMLVVLVIMGMLAGLVGPRMFGQVDASKAKTAKTQIKMLKGSLETMRLDTGRFPTEDEGLDTLYERPQEEPVRSRWRGPYLDEAVPPDPWGNDYQYSIPGANGQPFALYSFGGDGQLGGTDINEDVGYLPGDTE